jgi:serine/threonine-protein kinase
MARLHHPNIVTVHDVGFDAQALFLVLELVDGGTLMDLVGDHGPVSPKTACTIMRDVCSALQCAHDLNVVHRDVKPHNVLLTLDGVPKVADFGIARLSDEVERPGDTRSGIVMGTWAYMAPEQRSSARAAEARSDIYAAGATLYTLLTGKEPLDLFATAADDELRREVYEGIPAPVAALIERATRYRAKDRYETAAEMAEAIAQVVPTLSDDGSDLGRLIQSRSGTTQAPLNRESMPGRPTTASESAGPAPGRTELPWAGGTATPAPSERALPPLRRSTPAPATAPEVRRPQGVPTTAKPALPPRRRGGPSTASSAIDPDSVATPAPAIRSGDPGDLYGLGGPRDRWDTLASATPAPSRPATAPGRDDQQRTLLYGGEIGPEDPTSVDEILPDVASSGPALLYDPDELEADVVAYLPGVNEDDPFADLHAVAAPAPAPPMARPAGAPLPIRRPDVAPPPFQPEEPAEQAAPVPAQPQRPATPVPARKRPVRVRPKRHPLVLGSYLAAAMALSLVVSALATAQVLRSPPPPAVRDVPGQALAFLEPRATPSPRPELLGDPTDAVDGLPAGHGMVSVDAKPKSVVRVAGTAYPTPFEAPMPTGDLTVIFESSRGEKAERILRVSEGKRVSYCHDFATDGACD